MNSITQDMNSTDWLADFLPKLRCPRTLEPLSRSDDGLSLINASRSFAYPIIDGIPHLLPDSARPLQDAAGASK